MSCCCNRFARCRNVVAAVLPAFVPTICSFDPLLAVSTSVKAGALTGFVVLAILSGTIAIGTIAAYLLNRTSGRKGVAIAVLALMIVCAVVIAFTMTPMLYVTIRAKMS